MGQLNGGTPLGPSAELVFQPLPLPKASLLNTAWLPIAQTEIQSAQAGVGDPP